MLFDIAGLVNSSDYGYCLAKAFHNLLNVVYYNAGEFAAMLGGLIGFFVNYRLKKKKSGDAANSAEASKTPGSFYNGIDTQSNNENKKAKNNVLLLVFSFILFLVGLFLLLAALIASQLFEKHNDFTLVSNIEKANCDYEYFGEVKVLDGVTYPYGEGRIYEVGTKRDGGREEEALVYHGKLKKGMLHGNGKKYEYEGGKLVRITEGTWVNDKLSGEIVIKGIINGSEEVVFQGDYYEGKRNGRGREIEYDVDGTITKKYVGSFFLDKYDGFGTETVYAENGIVEKYSGQWKDGAKCGACIRVHMTDVGETLVDIGSFENGAFSGERALYDARGNFVGRYTVANDRIAEVIKPNSSSALYRLSIIMEEMLTDGSDDYEEERDASGKRLFKGDFFEGKRNGRGEEIENDESGQVQMTYTGGFYENEREGFGIETVYSEGKIVSKYSGQWKNGVKEGIGTWEVVHNEREKLVYVGRFVNDMLNGECIVYDTDGKIVDCGIYVDGEMSLRMGPSELYGDYPVPDRMF